MRAGSRPAVDRVLREQAKYGEALEATRTARAKHPEDIKLLYLEAATLADLNRVDEGCHIAALAA